MTTWTPPFARGEVLELRSGPAVLCGVTTRGAKPPLLHVIKHARTPRAEVITVDATKLITERDFETEGARA